jgi:hypothetical protein
LTMHIKAARSFIARSSAVSSPDFVVGLDVR